MLAPDGAKTAVTAAQATRVLDVTEATIRKWAQLGRIQSVGKNSAGKKLYRYIDLAIAEEQTRLRGGREKRCIKLSA